MVCCCVWSLVRHVWEGGEGRLSVEGNEPSSVKRACKKDRVNSTGMGVGSRSSESKGQRPGMHGRQASGSRAEQRLAGSRN